MEVLNFMRFEHWKFRKLLFSFCLLVSPAKQNICGYHSTALKELFVFIATFSNFKRERNNQNCKREHLSLMMLLIKNGMMQLKFECYDDNNEFNAYIGEKMKLTEKCVYSQNSIL